ncbi:hypothetical protein AA13594_1060 [Gluconacetobacter azotocaptans DSM 13594]|nr:hypothetical protein AA13594_1060 [Gluconacetobacter azotocaptans DSM 13594]
MTAIAARPAPVASAKIGGCPANAVMGYASVPALFVGPPWAGDPVLSSCMWRHPAEEYRVTVAADMGSSGTDG